MRAEASPPFDSEEHLFELKWDGIRALGLFGAGKARIQGRKLDDRTERYPEIAAALEELPGEGILDGEIVVLDEEGKPDFQRVLARDETRGRDQARLKALHHPACYVAYDLLARDGRSLLDEPLVERKRLLSELLARPPSRILESVYVLGRGKELYQRARELGVEGVVAKRLSSRYVPGARTRDWLNLKVRLELDAVVVGVLRERRTKRIKSLVLGGAREGRLVWLGNVGSGLDEKTLRDLASLHERLRSDAPPSFTAEGPGEIFWIVPRLVARVEYTGLTKEKRLRQPVLLGFVDKPPEDCLAPF